MYILTSVLHFDINLNMTWCVSTFLSPVVWLVLLVNIKRTFQDQVYETKQLIFSQISNQLIFLLYKTITHTFWKLNHHNAFAFSQQAEVFLCNGDWYR